MSPRTSAPTTPIGIGSIFGFFDGVELDVATAGDEAIAEPVPRTARAGRDPAFVFARARDAELRRVAEHLPAAQPIARMRIAGAEPRDAEVARADEQRTAGAAER